jgi:hypothetical protein
MTFLALSNSPSGNPGTFGPSIFGIVLYPAPTYLIGVDERQEKAYIVAVHGSMNKKISSLSTAHELNGTSLKHLWDEVCDY